MQTLETQDWDETTILEIDKRTHTVATRNETETTLEIVVTPRDMPPQSRSDAKEKS